MKKKRCVELKDTREEMMNDLAEDIFMMNLFRRNWIDYEVQSQNT